MLIDADVHISPTPQGGNSISVDELLRRMDRSGVDKAVTWLQPPYQRGEIDQGNAYVYEATQQHPDRIIGFGWADPNLGVTRAKEDVARCVDDYGLYGVKLNGAQNDFVIDDASLSMPVVEEIAKHGVVLGMHIGADAFDKTHPSRAGRIAAAFPELRILMIHMGGVGHSDLTRAAIEVGQEHPNITMIGSAVKSVPVLKAIKTLGAERVCFGSDTPFELMHVELAKYRALLDGEVTEQERDDILGNNIARLLRLDGT